MPMFRHADFNNFIKYAVGFDSIFDSMTAVLDNTSVNTNYPPHNLIELAGERYLISMALAGYSKDDLTVEWKDRLLVVKGDVSLDKDEEGVEELIYHGIAKRKFSKMFALGEYIEVENVMLKDGMLSITLNRVVPDAERLKLISIN